jgi:AcrR family transcriptional regulator
LPRAERQAQVLDAAAAAFAHTGFGDTSMDDVATAAGVTRLIVYRNFPSKEELYRAVLERVANRLGEEFELIGPPPGRAPVVVNALLRVAREQPDGFRLLWVHAAHEPAFASYAAEFRELAVDYARQMLVTDITDPMLLAWASNTIVGHVYDAVLTWLQLGDPADDESFVAFVSAGLRALVTAWAAVP